MGRLGLLIVLLAVVIAAAVVVQLRVAPEVALSPMAQEGMPKRLSRTDEKRLEVLQASFVKERDTFLQMRTAGQPKDKLEAQQAKASTAAQAVIALGGQNALKSVGKSKYATDSKPGEKNAAKSEDPGSEATAASCSGESCSTEGGTCTPSSAEKPATKEAKPAKAEAAAKPAAPKKP